jgi:hypothetical protein
VTTIFSVNGTPRCFSSWRPELQGSQAVEVT